MFTAALLVIAKMWKQTKCLLTDEWTKCGIYTHWNTIQLWHYAEWNQPMTEREVLHDSVIWESKIAQSIESKNRMVIAKGWWSGKMGTNQKHNVSIKHNE